MTISASGILLTTPEGQALFLKRGAGGDHAGEWCLPGGKIEDGESAIDAAKRETIEEIGDLPEGTPTLLCRSQAVQSDDGETVDFTTYTQRVASPFAPTLSDEHTAFAWASLTDPPQPLHPGTAIAVQRVSMTELDVARAIADGRLTSPQQFGNMALFDIRISGTGLAYRAGRDEFVWRKPEEYLNDEMVARCNGLPVVWEHQKGDDLTSKDFNERIVGMVMLPFIRGEDLRGIARIYDAATIDILSEGGMSTSPTVILKKDQMTTMKLEDGSNLLVEGVPHHFDSVALCERGVWDKGGPATGVAAETRKDSVMTEEERKAADKARKDAEEKEEGERKDRARKDAETEKKFDTAIGLLDSLAKRMDAWEEEKKADKSRKDAEEKEEEERKADKAKKDAESKKDEGEDDEKVAADKAKKDAEDEEERKRADRARKDSEDTSARIAALEARIPKALSDADIAAFADVQSRADSVMSAFGKQAPRPLDGESVLGYRRRLATMLKEHSPAWKGVNISTIHDDAMMNIAETQVYKDAMEAAKNPVDLPEGELRAVTTVNRETGQRSTSFYGKNTFVKQFAAPVNRVTKIGGAN